MATGWTEVVGHWQAMASEDGVVNNNNGTVTIKIKVTVKNATGGALNWARYYVQANGATLGYVNVSVGSTKGNTASASFSLTISKSTSTKTQSYSTIKIKFDNTPYGGSVVSNWYSASGSLSFSIPPLSNFTITYNANGGAGAPASQSKREQTTVYISSTIPTRSGYEFLGWATSASATTPSYQPNQAYTTNANLSLYALWEKRYASYVKVSGEWKLGITYVKENDAWKEADLIYVKENGSWKTI